MLTMMPKESERLDSVGNAESSYDVMPDVTPTSDNSESSAGSFAASLEYRKSVSELSKGLSNMSVLSMGSESNARISAETEEWMTQERKVRWGSLDVRMYPTIPGDHPDCEQGPPLTMGWDHFKEASGTIDEYEARRKPRRHEEDLRLSWLERRRKLKRVGFEDDQLFVAQDKAKQARKLRSKTVERLKYERYDEIKQSIFRRMGRTFHPRAALKTKY